MDKQSYSTRFYYPNGIGENKSTGVVGVYRTMKTMRSGNEYPYYETTVHVKKGKAVTRAASVEKWSEVGAFLKMAMFRMEKLQEIYGGRFNKEKFCEQITNHLSKIR